MKSRIYEQEMVVEVNPSSNRIIGPMDRYGQHHVFHLTLDDQHRLRRQVRVSVADISRFGRSGTAGLGQKLGGHADEHETSLMLAIAPDSVRLDRASPDYGHQLNAPASVFYQPTIFSPDERSGLDYSQTGARGDPSLATPEKGHVAFAAMVDDLTDGLTALFPDLAGPDTRGS